MIFLDVTGDDVLTFGVKLNLCFNLNCIQLNCHLFCEDLFVAFFLLLYTFHLKYI